MLAVTFTKIQIGGFPISVALQSMPFKKTHFMHGFTFLKCCNIFYIILAFAMMVAVTMATRMMMVMVTRMMAVNPLFLHLPLSECGIILAFLQGAA